MGEKEINMEGMSFVVIVLRQAMHECLVIQHEAA
jgi:hypothetical protein